MSTAEKPPPDKIPLSRELMGGEMNEDDEAYAEGPVGHSSHPMMTSPGRPMKKPMRDTALSMIDKKIAVLKHRLGGLELLQERVRAAQAGSPEEEMLWMILQGGFRRI